LSFNPFTPTVFVMGTAIKRPVPDLVKPLRGERQSARMSKITNDGLTRSGTGCFIAVGLPIMATAGVRGLICSLLLP